MSQQSMQHTGLIQSHIGIQNKEHIFCSPEHTLSALLKKPVLVTHVSGTGIFLLSCETTWNERCDDSNAPFFSIDVNSSCLSSVTSSTTRGSDLLCWRRLLSIYFVPYSSLRTVNCWMNWRGHIESLLHENLFYVKYRVHFPSLPWIAVLCMLTKKGIHVSKRLMIILFDPLWLWLTLCGHRFCNVPPSLLDIMC